MTHSYGLAPALNYGPSTEHPGFGTVTPGFLTAQDANSTAPPPGSGEAGPINGADFTEVGSAHATAGSFVGPDSLEIEWEQYRGLMVRKIHCSGVKKTREEIVLQELLVRPGDSIDPDLIAESERNLRKLQYLGSAIIVPDLDQASGSVDLDVRVTERWSWIAFAVPSLGGDRFDLNFHFSDQNFLGRGQQTGVDGRITTEEADHAIFFFHEPRLAGTRWGTTFTVGKQGDLGMQYAVSVYRPLYRIASRWSFITSLYDVEWEGRYYGRRITLSKYDRRSRGGSIGVTRRFSKKDGLIDLGFDYSYEESEHSLAAGREDLMPSDKKRGLLGINVRAEKFRYVKDYYVYNLGPVEDLKLGPSVWVRVDGSHELLGSDRDYPAAGLGFGLFEGSPGWGYVRGDISARARVENGELTNIASSGSAALYLRTSRRGMLAFQATGNSLHRTEDPSQLLLDSFNHLRGYQVYTYVGDRRVTASIELRQAVWTTRWWTGAVVLFTDAGMIWQHGEPTDDLPLLLGSGLGLRLGVPWFLGAPVFRADFGYGFKENNFDVSVAFGQRF